MDHCVSGVIAETLKAAGHKVLRVSEITDPRAPDRDVAGLAAQRGAVLVTADSDFLRRGDFPPKRYCGIVVLKDLHRAPNRVLRRLLRVLGAEDLNGVLAVLDGRSTRFKT